MHGIWPCCVCKMTQYQQRRWLNPLYKLTIFLIEQNVTKKEQDLAEIFHLMSTVIISACWLSLLAKRQLHFQPSLGTVVEVTCPCCIKKIKRNTHTERKREWESDKGAHEQKKNKSEAFSYRKVHHCVTTVLFSHRATLSLWTKHKLRL